MGQRGIVETVAAEEKGGSVSSRRTGSVAAVAVAIALAVVVVSLALAPKPADAATRVVTKNFSKPASILMPAGAVPSDCSSEPTTGPATPYPSKIGVNAFPKGSRVLDVNIRLEDYSHTFPDDVDVLLVHGTRNLVVLGDAGGNNEVNNITLTLDDEATNGFLPGTDQLVSGRFKPSNYEDVVPDSFPAPAPPPSPESTLLLSTFDGQSPNGAWNLFVFDDGSSDCGQFGGGWSIKITARVPA